MIVVKIQGGIGNQLFQYALALALKKRNSNKIIAIDKTLYNSQNNNITNRAFSLDVFNLVLLKEANLSDILGRSFFSRLKNKLKQLLVSEYKKPVIIEKTKLYNPFILNIKDNIYLDGYWQSYKYFAEVEDILRMQLAPLQKIKTVTSDIIASKEVSISLHIRRGDYLTKYASIYCQLNTQYYYNAIELIKSKTLTKKCDLFVFSDDIEWCKLNFNFSDDVTYVENEVKPAHEDLVLMSLCTHNIISNSSYSWWAAWLNTNLNKIVIAPGKWYCNQEPSFKDSIYPASWTVL